MNEIQYRQIRIIVLVAVSIVASVFAWKFLEQGYEVIDRYTCDPSGIIVEEGDSLYSIARANCSGNINVAVDEIYSYYGANIRPGQLLHLPHTNGCPVVLTEGNIYEDC